MAVAIVTGGSRGFGRALARELVGDGWSVVIDGRDPGVLASAAEELRLSGGRLVAVAGDVVDAAHRGALVSAARDLGGVDLLVANASSLGATPLPVLGSYPLDVFRSVLETNLVAPLGLVQEALPDLRRAHGTVVTISSDAAVEPYPTWGAYGASKAALDQLCAVLAVEEDEVRFLSFDPGDMRTEMHQAAYPGEDISDRPEPERIVPTLRALLASDAGGGRHTSLTWSDR